MTVTNAMPGCAVSYRLSLARLPAQPKGDVMSVAPRRFSDLCRRLVLVAFAASLSLSPPALAAQPSDIESNLTIAIGGAEKHVSLAEAMAALNIPAASIALIDKDQIAFARAYGDGVTPDTLFQAASLSKFVTAVGAMRLVDQQRLSLDADVNAGLTSWKVPTNAFDEDHPVTLRGLLSMTGGVGVPGFVCYQVDAPLPTLTQILDGAPPANSPPVTVIAMPSSAYHYSGGGYEIVEALMADTLDAPFLEGMDALVLKPAEMTHSTFAQPLPSELAPGAAKGHYGDGNQLPGGWRICPEHAAAGLWSTPSDLANLLLLVARAWRGESRLFLSPEAAREMLKPQNGGPYGLGAAVRDGDGSLIVMKRGQNVGYQGYLILLPAEGQGLVVMTNSDNGSILAEALIRRAAQLYSWPPLGPLPD
jgi:CubicO group peptidase (beta-lactamase class C family)